MISLLNLKTTAIAFAAGTAVAGYAAYTMHGWRMDAKQALWDTERVELVATTTAAANKQCDALNAKSEAVANALKTDLDSINSRYVRLLKQKPVIARCLPLAAATTTSDGSAKPDVPTVRGGVAAEWLTDAAYDCDRQAARLVACQSALNAVYK